MKSGSPLEQTEDKETLPLLSLPPNIVWLCVWCGAMRKDSVLDGTRVLRPKTHSGLDVFILKTFIFPANFQLNLWTSTNFYHYRTI